MINQSEQLLRAGLWLGPAVLGSLCFRLLSDTVISAGDDLAGGMVLAVAAIVWTVAGVRSNDANQATIAPAVFGLMFIASWYIR
jgi:hypothetical protein